MEKPSTYIVGTPLYEKTQGDDTNQIIVYGNITLGLLTACLWVFLAFQPTTPPLITASTATTTILILDRAVWTICHTFNKSTVTDAPDVHSLERTCFFLYLLSTLIFQSRKQVSGEQCEPKPVTGTILDNGKKFIVENTGDNTLDFCDFIQNEATATVLWALCTVPPLLLLGAGWKTLKATQKQNSEETTWVPFVALICLWAISEIVDFWRGLSIKIRLAYIVILVASFLVVTVISLIIRAS